MHLEPGNDPDGFQGAEGVRLRQVGRARRALEVAGLCFAFAFFNKKVVLVLRT